MDARFARLRSDPRFRRPRKDKSKLVVDQRFKGVFEPKTKTGRVDKYGRPISAVHEQENLRRFYRLESEDVIPPPLPDYARGEALLESSDEESDASLSDAEHYSTDPIDLAGGNADADIDLDEENFADLDAQAAEYSKSHPDEDHAQVSQTNRLAVVNLDWDHVRAVHLFKICSSLVSPTASSMAPPHSKISSEPSRVVRGKVLSVRIYTSDFGKERLAREEKEGPPPEIFKQSQLGEDEEVNEKNIYNVGDENEYDEDALRKYQLERLRYFYAIITCDTPETAAHIFSELEGTELERSANIFDLSFVPDDMAFDQEFRDEATDDDSAHYRGVDFVTDALRHSKVKLTWDEDDPERNRVTRRALTRKEMEEADYSAFLASSEDDSDDDQHSGDKSKSKSLSRDKLRSLLLSSGGDELPEGWDRGEDVGDVDMEITFTPGLTESKSDRDETTLEKYQRKTKEKRKKKKAETREEMNAPDEFFDAEDDAPAPTKQSKSSAKKNVVGDKPSRSVSTTEELSLLVSADRPTAEPPHFNMKTIIKAEKERQRKGKKKRKMAEDELNEMQEDFTLDVNDSRFKVLHEEHAFAIDPSNPHFKKTKGMDALLQERAKRQRQKQDVVEGVRRPAEDGRSLQNLVESVKRKSNIVAANGKRRKLQD
ncbi:hypothetical protein GGX14DRAFT_639656 [Mycena pura]|uniref:NUC153 domain-containing protein n=1 Tax=Mycena pura TaxID=153505 RepID=A0AAD6YPC3_9AGAR|nr:hypothetical protein GGX14DRAFT_639656 [Mycena pura]